MNRAVRKARRQDAAAVDCFLLGPFSLPIFSTSNQFFGSQLVVLDWHQVLLMAFVLSDSTRDVGGR